jgi:hypothetical protein
MMAGGLQITRTEQDDGGLLPIIGQNGTIVHLDALNTFKAPWLQLPNMTSEPNSL